MKAGDVPVVQLAGIVADLARTLDVVLSALEGGDQWEIDNAVTLARQTLALLDS